MALNSSFKSITGNGSSVIENASFYNLDTISALERMTFPKTGWNYLLYIMTIIGIIVILLNSYIFALFIRFRALRTKRNIFPLNLTISDCFVGYLVIPLFIAAEEMMRSETRSIWRHRIHHQSGVLLNFNSLVSIYSLTAVIVDRTVAITLPWMYRREFTTRKALIVTILIWTLSVIFACISFIVYKPLYDKDRISNMLESVVLLTTLRQNLRKYSYYENAFYGICVAGTVISGISLLIQSFAVRQTLRRKRKRATGNVRRCKPEDLKATYMLGLMFSTVLLWVTSIVYLQRSKYSRALHLGMFLGRFCLSIINPILYTLLKQDIRSKADADGRVVIGALQRCFHCRCFHRRRVITKQYASRDIIVKYSHDRKIDRLHISM